jgi:hypothetical protein
LSDGVVVISDGVAGSSGGEVGGRAGLAQAQSNPTAKIVTIVKYIFALSDMSMFFDVSLIL